MIRESEDNYNVNKVIKNISSVGNNSLSSSSGNITIHVQPTNSSSSSSGDSDLMDAANVVGLSVAICTAVLLFSFAAVLLWKARSRYSEYMLSSTNATTVTAVVDQQQGIAFQEVISLYPAIPATTTKTPKTQETGKEREQEDSGDKEEEEEETVYECQPPPGTDPPSI